MENWHMVYIYIVSCVADTALADNAYSTFIFILFIGVLTDPPLLYFVS